MNNLSSIPLYHIIDFLGDTANTIYKFREVCSQWKSLLRVKIIKDNYGIESVDIKNYHVDYIVGEMTKNLSFTSSKSRIINRVLSKCPNVLTFRMRIARDHNINFRSLQNVVKLAITTNYYSSVQADVLVKCIADHCPNVMDLSLSLISGYSKEPDFDSLFMNLKNLKSLYFSTNQLKIKLFESMYRLCHNLENLTCDGGDRYFTDPQNPKISQFCPTLKTFNLIQGYYSSVLAIDCSKLPAGLLHLKIHGTVTNYDIECISEACPNLISIVLESDKISRIECLSGPKIINVISCDLSDEFSLPDVTHLTELTLGGSNLLTDETLIPFIKKNPSLETININNATDKTIKAITLYCPKLKTLGLYKYRKISFAVLKTVPMRCKKLEHLNFNRSELFSYNYYRYKTHWKKSLSRGKL